MNVQPYVQRNILIITWMSVDIKAAPAPPSVTSLSFPLGTEATAANTYTMT